MQATERLYLTADKKKLVAEGDPRAAFLYAAPGDEIPESAAKMFGLAGGGLKRRKGGEDKSREPGDDKSGKGGGDKSGQGDPGSGSGAGDDLKKISGIGPATEKKLKEAGVVTYSGLAVLTKDQRTELDGILDTPGGADWGAWAEEARKLAGIPPARKAGADGTQEPTAPTAGGGLTIEGKRK